MITFILKLLVLFYLFYMIRYIHDMLQYKNDASIVTINVPHKERILEELKGKQPLVVLFSDNNLGLTFESMNKKIPGYIIKDGETLVSLDKLLQSDTFSIHKNSNLVKDYQLSEHNLNIYDYFTTSLHCGKSIYLSLYKGSQSIPLTKNYREHLIIQSLLGQVIMYLFNPKHEKDIKGLTSIKKWAIKVELQKGQVISIPCEWSYFYESSEDVILSHIEYDSYYSFLFNYVRKK